MYINVDHLCAAPLTHNVVSVNVIMLKLFKKHLIITVNQNNILQVSCETVGLNIIIVRNRIETGFKSQEICSIFLMFWLLKLTQEMNFH